MVAVVPLTPPVVPVTVVAVPLTVCVVNVTVAIPLLFVFDVAAENEPLPSDLVQVTTWPDVETALPLTSANCALIVTPAPAIGLVLPAVTRYWVAVPAAVVNADVVPVMPPVAPVAVCAVPDVVLVVNETVATPLPLVVDVAEPKLPPLVLDQVTVLPAVATELLLASASWAVIVTLPPAVGVALDDVTRYLVAVPEVPVAVKPTGSPVSTMPATVACMELAPAVVPNVQEVSAATPDEFVVTVAGLTDPPPPVTAKATSMPGTALLLASRTMTDGAVETADPATAVWLLPAFTAICVAVPTTTANEFDVPVSLVVGLVAVIVNEPVLLMVTACEASSPFENVVVAPLPAESVPVDVMLTLVPVPV